MRSRPKNLNLFTISFPLPAIISILHRLSGFFLFLLIPFLLGVLDLSFTESGYASLQECLGGFYTRLFVWLLLIPFFYHLVAGIRHLLMDVQVGSTLKAGRLSAILVLIFSLILILLSGIWLW